VASDTASAYTGSGAFLLGANPLVYNLRGQLDEVRVWTRVLCQDEIQATMNCELTGSQSQLAAYYNFNQGLDSVNNAGVTTLPDLAGGDNNGTLTNFALNGTTSNWVAPGGVTSGVSCAPFLPPDINVKGNSVSIADGDTTPSAADDTDFSSASVSGGTVTHTFTIENTGTAGLTVSSITKSGTHQADFTIGGISLPMTINAGGSTTFTVTFDPSATGTRTATINVANSDCDESAYDFSIQGSGSCVAWGWTGATSSNWDTASNWECNSMPSANADVTLPATGVTNEAAISNSDVTVNNLTLGTNRTLAISGNHTLTVGGVLAMNGGNITVASGSTLIIGASGGISRTSGYVIGALKKIVGAGALASSPTGGPIGFTFPVGTANGYSPVVASFTGTGDLTVKATQGPQPDQNPSVSLQRYWTLTGTGLTADLTFNYLQADVAGNESSYQLFKVVSGVTTRFPHNPPGVVIDTSANTAFISGVSSFSDWTLGEPSAPSAVDLVSMKATGYDGGVFVEWQTGFEVSNLGFNVYREQAGRRSLVNSDIIAGSALKVGPSVAVRSGYSYAWWDKLSKNSGDAVYYLEDLDINGRSTLHGPFKVNQLGGKPPALSQADTLSKLSGGKLFVGPPSLASPSAKGSTGATSAQLDLAGKPAVKMTVKDEGWYRVTQPELVQAGFDSRINPRNLQLFADGVEQQMLVAGETDGSFDPSDSVEFYAAGQNTLATDARIYWLTAATRRAERCLAR
jgi:HYDIN/CFA65/VesB family protein